METIGLPVLSRLVLALSLLAACAHDQGGIGEGKLGSCIPPPRDPREERAYRARGAQLVCDGIARTLAGAVQNGMFPLSAAPVPSTLPRGGVEVSADWSAPTWVELGRYSFLPPAVDYQYEIVVSPDRRHARVIARGDLDGNGIEANFEIPVDIGDFGKVTVGELSVVRETE